jgi:zinc transport system ATP-binding protein
VSPANTSASEAAIHVEHLWLSMDGEPVLEDINLSVPPLGFVGLIGPNGGGKTTLLRILLGLTRPDRGCVRIQGQAPEDARPLVGYVPQAIEFDRAFPITVREVVQMGRLHRRGLLRRFTAEDDEAVDHALASVRLDGLHRRPLADLSGGERQRALIARALAVEPSLLLLDEPTSSVDSRIRGSVFELLAELNGTMTILLVTHDMAAISTAVKTVGCLNRRLHYHGGREVSAETLEEVYQCPIELIAHGVPHRVFPEHHHGHTDA